MWLASVTLGRPSGPRDTGPAQTLQIGRAERITCSQRQPHRNRHCLLSLPRREITLPAKLPCAQSCWVSLVGEAVNRKAKPGHKVVVGSHERSGKIHQSRSDLVVARTRPGDAPPAKPLVSTKPRRKQLPLVDEGQGVRDRVVYSVPVKAPRAGEQIFAEAALRIRIGHLKHKVAVRNQIVLAEKPTATQPGRAARRITADKKRGKISLRNGWTCTKGPSAHKSPCLVHKPGAIRIASSSPRTFYVNLVVGTEARLLDGQRFRKGKKARVGRGSLRVWRYPR